MHNMPLGQLTRRAVRSKHNVNFLALKHFQRCERTVLGATVRLSVYDTLPFNTFTSSNSSSSSSSTTTITTTDCIAPTRLYRPTQSQCNYYREGVANLNLGYRKSGKFLMHPYWYREGQGRHLRGARGAIAPK